MSTKERILTYLHSHGACSGMELEMQAREWFTKPSTISRRARELVQEGKIECEYGAKHTVSYRVEPKPLEQAAMFEPLRTI